MEKAIRINFLMAAISPNPEIAKDPNLIVDKRSLFIVPSMQA
jgi:hypothetical protein